jgi:hypothetical protein
MDGWIARPTQIRDFVAFLSLGEKEKVVVGGGWWLVAGISLSAGRVFRFVDIHECFFVRFLIPNSVGGPLLSQSGRKRTSERAGMQCTGYEYVP